MRFTFELLEGYGGTYRAINNENNQKHIIRWFVKNDYPEVMDIEELSFEYPWSEEEFDSARNQRNCNGMVSEKDGRVTGYIFYELYQDKSEISNFAVNPDDRRNGFASSLVELLKYNSHNKRRKEMNIIVRETNLECQLFCGSQDFRAVKILRGFYYNSEEDAYVMKWKRDRATSLFVPNNRISQYFP